MKQGELWYSIRTILCVSLSPSVDPIYSLAIPPCVSRYKAYDGTSYDGRCSFFGGSTALPEGLGWFIIVGTGGIFALAVNFFMWLAARAVPERHRQEMNTVRDYVQH
jgi:hypothetical protein